jgi:hypothetical protein
MSKNKFFICGIILRQGMKWSTSQENTQYKLGICYMLFDVTVLLLKHLWKLQMRWYPMGKYIYTSVTWSKWTYNIMQKARLISKQKACLSSWVIQICLFLYNSSLLRYDVTVIGTQLLCFKGACCLHVQRLRSPRKETKMPGTVFVYCFKKWPRTHSAEATWSVSWWRQRTQ